MRKLVVIVVILAALAVVVDRVGVAVVTSQVAARIQSSQHLSEKPTVSIGGVPFLTQVFGGRYDRVSVSVHGLMAGDIRLSDVSVTAQGVHLSLHQVFSADFAKVTVDKALATVTVTYADLNARLKKDNAQADFSGGKLHVSGHVNVGGAQVPASGDGVLSVSSGDLALRVVNVRTSGGIPVPDAVAAAAGMGATVKGSDLPFGIRFLSAGADGTGLVITAGASGLAKN